MVDSKQGVGAEDCRQRSRRLFESAPMVAYSLDSQLRTVYISPYCLKVFGYTDGEIQQDRRFWDRHIHPDDREMVCRERELFLKKGEGFTLEYRVLRRDQSVGHIINHTIPVALDNRLHSIDGFVFDITTRKRLEEQQLLTERIKVLNDMSLSVAHEIRNPLTSIGGFARLLDRRMASDDPNRAHLGVILKEVSRLEMTLNRVLDNFKRIRLHLVPNSINKVITKVITQLNHEIHHMGIKISTKFSNGLPEICLDRHLMEEGLRTLIRTALQSMKSGEELAIATSLNLRQVVIEINGVGPDAEPFDNGQLFFPFYREPAFAGGFGIPLSQQIINQHGGSIVFKNGSDKPASLTITLPITNAHPAS